MRSAILLLVAAAATAGTVAILSSCRAGTAWEAMTAALLTGSAAAIALAAFLPLRQRAAVGAGGALLLGGAHGAVWLAVIEAADVGDHCFH